MKELVQDGQVFNCQNSDSEPGLMTPSQIVMTVAFSCLASARQVGSHTEGHAPLSRTTEQLAVAGEAFVFHL